MRKFTKLMSLADVDLLAQRAQMRAQRLDDGDGTVRAAGAAAARAA